MSEQIVEPWMRMIASIVREAMQISAERCGKVPDYEWFENELPVIIAQEYAAAAIIRQHYAPLLEELQKDKKRLDWLEKNATILKKEAIGTWKLSSEITYKSPLGATLRTCIDVALRAAKEGR